MSTYSNHPGLDFRAINSSAQVGDDSFGPFYKLPGKATFDFTLLFEETILSIGPSSLFLLLIPPRLFNLWKTSRQVKGSYLLTTKIVNIIPHSRLYIR